MSIKPIIHSIHQSNKQFPLPGLPHLEEMGGGEALVEALQHADRIERPDMDRLEDEGAVVPPSGPGVGCVVSVGCMD
jgi:hypothetical protein